MKFRFLSILSVLLLSFGSLSASAVPTVSQANIGTGGAATFYFSNVPYYGNLIWTFDVISWNSDGSGNYAGYCLIDDIPNNTQNALDISPFVFASSLTSMGFSENDYAARLFRVFSSLSSSQILAMTEIINRPDYSPSAYSVDNMASMVGYLGPTSLASVSGSSGGTSGGSVDMTATNAILGTIAAYLNVLVYTSAFACGLIVMQLAINGKNARRLW